MFGTIILIICCYNSVMSTSVEDWYWRDYNGLIPSDALAGGINIKGEQTYLGQITVPSRYTPQLSPFAILTAIISSKADGAFGSYYGRIVNSRLNVKILCASSTERYMWLEPIGVIPVGCKYVVGGSEVINNNTESTPSFIGTVARNDSVITGRLLLHGGGIPLMYYPYNGAEETTYNYKALFYCPN